MALAVLIGIDDRLVGTGFIAAVQDEMVAIVTALHLIGNGQNFRVGIPPHGGDTAAPQTYPLPAIAALEATLALAEPLMDIAILLVQQKHFRSAIPLPRFISSPNEVRVGDEVLVVGYPFASIRSFLETVEPCFISALGNRVLGPNVSRRELILAHPTHPGSSGSPVIRRADGTVCGIVRGCLAPPGVLSIGNLPLGTDTNVTYATSTHIVPALVSEAIAIGKAMS